MPYLPNHASTKLSYYIKGGNPPNLTEKINEIGENVPLFIERQKKPQM
jgi:hypothetical protein